MKIVMKSKLMNGFSAKNVTASIALILSVCAHSGEPTAPQEAARIYNETCVVCHGDGVGGAPRPGDKSSWEQRLSYGIEEVYLNAIEGLGPAMPPRGMCTDCTDDQMKAVVDFMLLNLE